MQDWLSISSNTTLILVFPLKHTATRVQSSKWCSDWQSLWPHTVNGDAWCL